jgi:hypothetical protein
VLAFGDADILTQLRLAVLIASLASGLAGALWLSVAKSRDQAIGSLLKMLTYNGIMLQNGMGQGDPATRFCIPSVHGGR